MNTTSPQITNTKFLEIVRTYWAWRRLWIATTVAFGSVGLIYVLFLKSDMWTAAQGLIVRDEANGAVMRLGRFQSQTEMKAAQETILEMARNTQVLREALLDIGPESSWFRFGAISKDWPSQSEVSDLADNAIGVRAPQGAEFGTTEVIYLDIKQNSRTRALDLNRAVCKALDSRLRQVRIARADGVIGELTRASAMAGDELRKATEQLQLIEREAGPDLADLRGLSEANGNGSTSRQMLDAVKTELRQLENQHNQLLSDRSLLRDTQVDPERLLSAPASILNAHPGLKKLREGLADAQLASSQLRGKYTRSHPLVYVALTSEGEIKEQLHSELALALSATEKDVENSQVRLDSLKRQQRQLEDRLDRLARIRAEHDNLNNEVRARTRIHQEAEKQLAEARASRDAALASSLLTRLDEPVLGERPAGPGRKTIFLGMTLAGLFFGLGIVFLLTPLDGNVVNSERWNEKLGRRISDRFPWLADADAGGSNPRRRRSDQNRRQVDRHNPAALTPSQRSAMAPAAVAASTSTSTAVAPAPMGAGIQCPAPATNHPAAPSAAPAVAQVDAMTVLTSSAAPVAALTDIPSLSLPQVHDEPAHVQTKPRWDAFVEQRVSPSNPAQATVDQRNEPSVAGSKPTTAPPSVQAAASQSLTGEATASQASAPAKKPGLNMFRPNQAATASQTAKDRTAQAPAQRARPSQPQPASSDMAFGAASTANAFETQVDANPVSFASATQVLPEGFSFHNSTTRN